MTLTPRLGAPVLAAAQALPEETVNEQAYLFDAFCCAHFKDRDLSAPPGSPAIGDTYLVAASPTGAWTGHAGAIAVYLNTAWSFVTPKEGFVFWVDDEDILIVYDGVTPWQTIGLSAGSFIPSSYLDTDGTLAANSDSKLATQKAVRTYVNSAVTGLLEWKGATDCSTNPNYPAASKGDAYTVSVAGKIGGASGSTVDVGDVFIATADNAGGTQASVGSSWVILEHNLISALAASFATTAEVRAGTSSTKVIAPDTLAGAMAVQTLTDGATVSWDLSTAINAKVTLGGNRTLAVSNPTLGATYSLGVTQDGTGSRTMTWPASFDWGSAGAPTLTTTASKRDRITLFCTDAATPKFDAFLSGKGFS
jgi:hypothetical protein